MSIATLRTKVRAAWRSKLLALIDIDHSPAVSVSLAQSGGQGVFTRASGSWLDAGFAKGMEVQALGFTGNPRGLVKAVTASALSTTITSPASQTVAGGGQFVVGLPIGRAWEGESFFPVDGMAYVAESVRPGGTDLKTIANPSGVGLAEHAMECSATFLYPKGYGTLAIESITGKLLSALAESPRRLSYGGISALIRSVESSALYDDGARIGCAVTASLLVFTQS